MRILEGIALRLQIQTVLPLIREAHIRKVILTDTRETCLELRSQFQTGFFVFSIHPENCFFYYTNQKPAMNRIKDNAWSQILNKYLVGAKIIDLEQIGWDRVIRLKIQNRKLWDRETLFFLYGELTGRNANCIITTTNSSPSILGCQKEVSPRESRFRTITIGEIYHLPPPKINAVDPLMLIQGESKLPYFRLENGLEKCLIQNIDGVGPFLASTLAESIHNHIHSSFEIIRAVLKERLFELCRPFYESQTLFSVYYSPQTHFPVGIFWSKSNQYDSLPHQDFPDLNQAVVSFVQTFWTLKKERNKKNRKRMYIEKELNFIEKELNKINQALVPELQLFEMQTKGNLLKLYPHLDCIEKKKNGLLVSNIFSKNQEKIFIDIDPRLSISQNMQRHFRNYRKSQTRNKILKKKKTELEFRRNYLQKQLNNGDDFHFSTPQKKDTSPPELFESGIIKYLTPSGNMILVGKNEKANHNLVTRFSRRDDYWFHVRDYPGSHVLFRVTQNPETIHQDLHLTAQIAAYFSSVRNDSNVNVIYASIQNVKTLPHAGLGKVIFRNEKNMNVTPGIPSGLRKI